MIVKIKRQDDNESKPYWQTFEYTGPRDTSIAYLLDALNFTDDLFDIEGKAARRIQWECSCMQKMCGACAIRINKRPALACNTFLKDIKGNVVILEPLSKFPVICDLIIDRTSIQKHLIETGAFPGQAGILDQKEYNHRYQAGKCIKCGLCLEVCPNYSGKNLFFCATYANDMYMLNSANSDRKSEIKKCYKEHFAEGCSKCLACQDVCPMEIPMVESIAKMNRRESCK